MEDFKWFLAIRDVEVDHVKIKATANAPILMSSPLDVIHLLTLLDDCKFCRGHPDKQFIKLINDRNGTICNPSGRLQHRYYNLRTRDWKRVVRARF